MKATFKVTFLLQKGKIKASGKAPIVTRIIVNGEMAHFSTQQEIEPDRWDAKGNRTLGLRSEERTINMILNEIKASLHRCYYDCQASGESVSALKLKNKLCPQRRSPSNPQCSYSTSLLQNTLSSYKRRATEKKRSSATRSARTACRNS